MDVIFFAVSVFYGVVTIVTSFFVIWFLSELGLVLRGWLEGRRYRKQEEYEKRAATVGDEERKVKEAAGGQLAQEGMGHVEILDQPHSGDGDSELRHRRTGGTSSSTDDEVRSSEPMMPVAESGEGSHGSGMQDTPPHAQQNQETQLKRYQVFHNNAQSYRNGKDEEPEVKRLKAKVEQLQRELSMLLTSQSGRSDQNDDGDENLTEDDVVQQETQSQPSQVVEASAFSSEIIPAEHQPGVASVTSEDDRNQSPESFSFPEDRSIKPRKERYKRQAANSGTERNVGQGAERQTPTRHETRRQQSAAEDSETTLEHEKMDPIIAQETQLPPEDMDTLHTKLQQTIMMRSPILCMDDSLIDTVRHQRAILTNRPRSKSQDDTDTESLMEFGTEKRRGGFTWHPNKFVSENLEPFAFTVERNGCNVETPYCRVQFPHGAVERSTTIEMRPDFNTNMEKLEEGRLYVSPEVLFMSSQRLKFDADVTVWLPLNYVAADPNDPITLQVERIDGNTGEDLLEVQHYQTSWVSFNVEDFCGFCIYARSNQFNRMQRLFYSIMALRQPQEDEYPPQHFVHWTIFDQCANILADVLKTCKENRFKVIQIQESFPVRRGHNIKLTMHCGEAELKLVKQNSQVVKVADRWGMPINTTKDFVVSKPENDVVELNCEIIGVPESNTAAGGASVTQPMQEVSIWEKCVTFPWKFALPSYVMKVSEHSTGIRYDHTYYHGGPQPAEVFQANTIAHSQQSHAHDGQRRRSSHPRQRHQHFGDPVHMHASRTSSSTRPTRSERPLYFPRTRNEEDQHQQGRQRLSDTGTMDASSDQSGQGQALTRAEQMEQLARDLDQESTEEPIVTLANQPPPAHHEPHHTSIPSTQFLTALDYPQPQSGNVNFMGLNRVHESNSHQTLGWDQMAESQIVQEGDSAQWPIEEGSIPISSTSSLHFPDAHDHFPESQGSVYSHGQQQPMHQASFQWEHQNKPAMQPQPPLPQPSPTYGEQPNAQLRRCQISDPGSLPRRQPRPRYQEPSGTQWQQLHPAYGPRALTTNQQLAPEYNSQHGQMATGYQGRPADNMGYSQNQEVRPHLMQQRFPGDYGHTNRQGAPSRQRGSRPAPTRQVAPTRLEIAWHKQQDHRDPRH